MSQAVGAYPCPCCRHLTISEPSTYEVCPVCGWEDDPAQSQDPDYAGGANRESLNKYRETVREMVRQSDADT
jgi:hypothetical protein